MAHVTTAPQRRNAALWSFVLLGVGLLSILLLTLVNPLFDSGSTAKAPGFDRVRIAYFEFGMTADTLWSADPASPSSRRKLLTIEHAPEYGIIPSLSLDSRAVAYTVLAPGVAAPGPDTPAQLWVAALDGTGRRLIASGADLLVPAAWSPDGALIVFRRSGSETMGLFAVPASGGAEQMLVQSSDALFPAGFSPDGGRFYYVAIGDRGSVLHRVDVTSGVTSFAAILSGGLTRDWALSPDGDRIAYLEMTFSGQDASARAFVLDLTTGERATAGVADADAFNPAWDAAGRLIVGQLRRGARSTAASISGADGASSLTAPARGFDVPLAVSASGAAAVTSFDGNSIVNPGRARLVVVDPAGVRQEIASGEVTFLGWINP